MLKRLAELCLIQCVKGNICKGQKGEEERLGKALWLASREEKRERGVSGIEKLGWKPENSRQFVWSVIVDAINDKQISKKACEQQYAHLFYFKRPYLNNSIEKGYTLKCKYNIKDTSFLCSWPKETPKFLHIKGYFTCFDWLHTWKTGSGAEQIHTNSAFMSLLCRTAASHWRLRQGSWPVHADYTRL